jgi:S1-C subfamily serine protease
MKNSPAEKAGFLVGDIIVAVNNNVSGNLQEYKLALQNTRTRVTVVVLRGDKAVELSIDVASIL